MDLDKIYEKGNIDTYIANNINYKFTNDDIKNIINKINEISPINEKDNFLEISHTHTLGYLILTNIFKKGIFISDDPFESLLEYHHSKLNNKELDIYNHYFSTNSLSSLSFAESFNFIFSLSGLSFENIYSILPQLINFLKIEGLIALLIPAYWYDRENATELEKKIINYSKQNDKKWIFVEDINPVITENGAEMLGLYPIELKIKINRLELAYISSLNKLYDAIINNNRAHLEICDIPEKNIELRSTLLIIKKKKKTITKDNLFKI